MDVSKGRYSVLVLLIPTWTIQYSPKKSLRSRHPQPSFWNLDPFTNRVASVIFAVQCPLTAFSSSARSHHAPPVVTSHPNHPTSSNGPILTQPNVAPLSLFHSSGSGFGSSYGNFSSPHSPFSHIGYALRESQYPDVEIASLALTGCHRSSLAMMPAFIFRRTDDAI